MNPLDKMTKLESRLRCVANGKTSVNSFRAQQNGAVRVTSTRKQKQAPELTTVLAKGSEEVRSKDIKKAKWGSSQTRLPKDVEVNIFLLLDRDDAKTPAGVSRRNGRIATATVSLDQLSELEKDPAIQSMELGKTLHLPDPRVGIDQPAIPAKDRFSHLNEGRIKITGAPGVSLDNIGENILVGIIDVGGIDFAHIDFMDDDGHSRVISIWDQGGDAFDPPDIAMIDGQTGGSAGYGSEITYDDIDFALAEAKAINVQPHDLAPQSQQIRGSHATHVASIAAGRSGICKRAKIAAVLISQPDSDYERGKSFYDGTSVVDAVAYLFALARKEGLDGVVVNISLGAHLGSHDGAELASRWLDLSLAEPGRAVCVAAGNSGQGDEGFKGDIRVWSGRIHTEGKIPSAGLRRDLEWVVIGNGIEDVSENELEIWYGAEDEFDVEIRTPDGRWIGPVAPGQRIENLMLKDKSVVSIYNVLSDAKNGDNRISVFLSPFMGKPVIGIAPGNWKVRITGKVVRNGAYNAWIERDDPRLGRRKGQWRLPSFFGPQTYVDKATINSLACGHLVTGVANLDDVQERLHASSSQGPTRDGRSKPEIAAPGTNIIAANGFDPKSKWTKMTGTSMASPYVTGVTALMLSLNPSLSAAQINGIIRRTSDPLPGGKFEWENGAGYGAINPVRCLEEALRVVKPVDDLTKEFWQ